MADVDLGVTLGLLNVVRSFSSSLVATESVLLSAGDPTMAKILAAADLSLATRLVPYDDHDDVLRDQEQRRSAAERVQIQADQLRLVPK